MRVRVRIDRVRIDRVRIDRSEDVNEEKANPGTKESGKESKILVIRITQD